ncbi:hypothetical protein Q3Z59_004594 [Salmonella enterica]|nr:hypothetical protein [Salmonella enterica]EBA6265853.1 hypothetical protein [Salmonella enterica]EBE1623910.1 hypothetical protein [Salmonella enterica]EFT9846136.1 hypothetical protein [Salmonella enterica]EGI0930731.1 hypothetical protein [Salmonella enterica]
MIFSAGYGRNGRYRVPPAGHAHLTHPVLPPGSGVKAVRRVWVDNSGGGYPAFTQLTHQGPNR